jgi:radical SAM superfamily enzyme YgiQ (UPF0313 family)
MSTIKTHREDEYMKQRVALVEFSILDQYPLISGYLAAYAKQSPSISASFEFVYYQREVERVSYQDTLREIVSLDASIICLSAYVWNMRLISRVVKDLRSYRGIKRLILGGHQVSHHIRDYVDRCDNKTLVINGQGEVAFRAVLERLAANEALEGLRGVSYFVDGELYDGGEADRVAVLDDIPSPFLTGEFDNMRHPITVLETNRGCPYKCTFCTWGGDTVKVAKFSLERVKNELLWIAKKSVLFIYIGDANWGMLARDIEISEYIANLKRKYGHPWMIYYAAAKNKPKGSIACIEKLYAGDVISSQALGIQSMNPATLSLIDRQNIKNSDFVEVFSHLNSRRIDSYCELIWPLPGETLESLKHGFDQLIDLGAHTTILYPAILINNARLTDQADEFGIESVMCDEWTSELKIVTATKLADRKAVGDGFWHYYAFFLLSNFDLRKSLLRYLRHWTGRSYAQIIGEFAAYLRDNLATSRYAQTIAKIFKDEAHGSLMTIGRVATHLSHEERAAALADVIDFIARRQLPNDRPRALILTALWAFSLPRVFADSKCDVQEITYQLSASGGDERLRFSDLALATSWERTVTLEIAPEFADLWSDALQYFCDEPPKGDVSAIEIVHPESFLVPYNSRDIKRNYIYAHGMICRLGYISPTVLVQIDEDIVA